MMDSVNDDPLEMEIEPTEEDSENSSNVPSDSDTATNENPSEDMSQTCKEEVKTLTNQTVYVCESCKNSNKSDVDAIKRRHFEDDDEGRNCPICFDVWTNSGDHRLCALRCGHLFGHSCLLRWLQGQRTCPTCKSSVRKTDIRFIYARKLIAQDTSEVNMLRKQLADERVEKQQLELQRVRHTFELAAQKNEIAALKMQLQDYINNVVAGETSKSAAQTDRKIVVYKDGELKFSQDSECRVMAYSKQNQMFAVSMMCRNAIFTGYGIRKVSATDFRLVSYVAAHSKAIRDISYHPERHDWLLSVSLDKSARIIDDVSRQPVLNVSSEHPLWSCCWDISNPNYFYVGMSNGSVCKHDVRKTDMPVMTSVAVPNDMSPVVALANTNAGLLVCKLCTCWIMERWPETENNDSVPFPGDQLPLEGPFVSMCYDSLSDNVLVSCRPNQSHPYSRHVVCKVTRSNGELSCKTVQIFPGAATQKMMTRSCLLNFGDGEILIAANQEPQKAVHIWSLKNKKQVGVISSYQPALDLCHVPNDNKHNFAVLNETKLSMYRFEYS